MATRLQWASAPSVFVSMLAYFVLHLPADASEGRKTRPSVCCAVADVRSKTMRTLLDDLDMRRPLAPAT
jgi:hypothetical protein